MTVKADPCQDGILHRRLYRLDCLEWNRQRTTPLRRAAVSFTPAAAIR